MERRGEWRIQKVRNSEIQGRVRATGRGGGGEEGDWTPLRQSLATQMKDRRRRHRHAAEGRSSLAIFGRERLPISPAAGKGAHVDTRRQGSGLLVTARDTAMGDCSLPERRRRGRVSVWVCRYVCVCGCGCLRLCLCLCGVCVSVCGRERDRERRRSAQLRQRRARGSCCPVSELVFWTH